MPYLGLEMKKSLLQEVNFLPVERPIPEYLKQLIYFIYNSTPNISCRPSILL